MARPKADPEELVALYRATGDTLWTALGAVATTAAGRALARREWDTYLASNPRGAEPVLPLLEVADASPRLAMDLLRVWLAGRHIDGSLDLSGLPWVTDVPGHATEGDLCLSGCRNLRSLGEGLVVGGHLEIARCRSLRALPKGLRLGGDLWADGCRSLADIPPDIVVGGRIHAGLPVRSSRRERDRVTRHLHGPGPATYA